MSHSDTPAASTLPCCFCGGGIVCGPAQDGADESARLGFLQFAPGDGAASFRAHEQEFYCHVACLRARLHDPASLRPLELWNEDDVNEERLTGACDDLVLSLITLPSFAPFRERLFGAPAERWLRVADLCRGIPLAGSRLAELDRYATHDLRLVVSHTPEPMDDRDYEMVVFAEPYLTWSNTLYTLRMP